VQSSPLYRIKTSKARAPRLPGPSEKKAISGLKTFCLTAARN
jgi:hypothetical protein